MSSGTVWWNELRTPDEEGAISFYSRLIGWQPFRVDAMDPRETPEKVDLPYTVWMMGWNQVGGMMKMSSTVKAREAMWFPFIAVDDVDACAQKAVELGGCVLEGPFNVPRAGRFAVLRDPQGAPFGIGRPEDEQIDDEEAA